jgi:hypothetical protein
MEPQSALTPYRVLSLYVGRRALFIAKKGGSLAINMFGGRVFAHRVVDNNEEMRSFCRDQGCFIAGSLVISCLLAVSFVGILLNAIWGGQKATSRQYSRDDKCDAVGEKVALPPIFVNDWSTATPKQDHTRHSDL